jgi:hypothetical protein
MPQDYNKDFTNLPEKNLKSIRKDAKEKEDFLESVRPELPDAANKKIKSIPFVGSFISSAVRGVTKKLQEPIDSAINANRKIKSQAWNETFKQMEIRDSKQNAGVTRDALGIKNDPNEYGKTALSGSNGKKK